MDTPAPGGCPLPRRAGSAPLVSTTPPVEQITQPVPVELQRSLCRRLAALPGVDIRPSYVCFPGSRAGHLAPTLAHGPVQAFLAGTEFAHLHPEYDGSLHLVLPPVLAEEVVAAGLGVPAEPRGSLLLYGPQDESQTETVWLLLQAAYRYACTAPGPTA